MTQDAATQKTILPGSLSSIMMAAGLTGRDRRAMERAVALSAVHGARLVFLHVMSEEVPASVRDRVAQAVRDEIESAIAASPAADRNAVDIRIVSGKGYREILAAADAAECDLIVMGTHAYTVGDSAGAGTTMERVLRHGKRPVLVVPDRAVERYSKVVIGVDFSVHSRFAIRHAAAFAPGAELFAVHAFQVPFTAFMPGGETRQAVQDQHIEELQEMIDQEMDLLLSSAGLGAGSLTAPHKVVVHGQAGDVLRAEVKRLQPDLLVLGTHGRVGIAHSMLGSVAEDFLNRPPCDVLAVKAW